MSKLILTQSRLKELLHYDPEVGKFTWLASTARCIKVGDIAGAVHGGYIRIKVCKKNYYAHRLAWLYMTGAFPSKDIDHKNGIKDCNIWENLRECTNQQNQFNVGAHANNTSGFKGVTWRKRSKKWVAQTRLGGIERHIGYFDTAEQASAAYQSFTKLHHGEFFTEQD